MYKILFFLNNSIDDKILGHFRKKTLKTLAELSGKEVLLAQVESNLLTEGKFSYYCEVEFNSKDEMDRMMNSKAGLELNKDLMDFHQFLTIININYQF